MAYVAPTADDIRERFAEFATAPSDEIIEQLISEASRYVDTTWLEGDYKTAIMYLTAHMLITEGANSNRFRAATPGPLTVERIGDAMRVYGSRRSGGAGDSGGGGTMADSELATTVYGVRYLNLRRSNHPGPVII